MLYLGESFLKYAHQHQTLITHKHENLITDGQEAQESTRSTRKDAQHH